MSASLLAVVVDCHNPRRQAEFWALALGYQVSQRNADEFQVSDPTGAGGSLYFMKVPEPKAGKNRLHLDVVTPEPMEAEVARPPARLPGVVQAGALNWPRSRPMTPSITPRPAYHRMSLARRAMQLETAVRLLALAMQLSKVVKTLVLCANAPRTLSR